MVAHCRNAAVNGARTDRNQDFALLAEFAQYMHVFGITQAAFYQTNVAGLAMLDVGKGGTVKLDVFQQADQPLIHVQKRHVATETACQ